MTSIESAPATSSLKGETVVHEPDRVSRAIARRSAEVRATVPDLECSIDVDAARATALAADSDVSLTAILVAACAGALRELPIANAAYRDGSYERYSRVNIGVTIATDAGLVVAAVLDADGKSLRQLTDELVRLQTRARTGELTPPEQAGTTFTLSDFSALAADRWSPLITPPQAAALTAGAVRPAPVLRDGGVVAGELITLTLACDHRVLFGRTASALLAAIAQRVREPVR